MNEVREFKELIFDDECVRDALETMLNLYENFLKEAKSTKDNDYSSDSELIKLNSKMIKYLNNALAVNKKIQKYCNQ